MRRVAYTPKPAGFRFYHSHVTPVADFNKGRYSGQIDPLYIKPRNEPGRYAREVRSGVNYRFFGDDSDWSPASTNLMGIRNANFRSCRRALAWKDPFTFADSTD